MAYASDSASSGRDTPPLLERAEVEPSTSAAVRTSPSAAVAAYEEELAKLREALRLLAHETGSTGVLEGKYLEQIRKCRTLSTALAAQKARAKALEQELQQLRAKDTRVVARAEPSSDAARSLRERLDRVYKQLHEKDAQLEEARRENGQLCGALMQETGASKEDVLRAVRRVSAHDHEVAGPRVGHGWQSRAAQIVLLRGRVKDLERALAERSGDGGDAAAAPAERSESADTATATTTARDVDDAARDHVAQLASRRLGTLRELESALAQRERELTEERGRQAALQARHQLAQQRTAQLRDYIAVILEKSASDDELIAAYKAELAQRPEGGTPRVTNAPSASENATELARLREEVTVLRQRLCASEETRNDDGAVVELQERMRRWIAEACTEKEEKDAMLPPASCVEAVLRAAHTHVLAAEARLQELERCHSEHLYDRYTRLLDSVGRRLTSAEGGDDVKEDVLLRQIAALPPIEPFVLQENKALKQRVRALTELAAKEAVAQRVRMEQMQRQR